MKSSETNYFTEINDDINLPERYKQATTINRGPALKFMVEAKDFVIDALSGLREHPVGSLEIGAAFAVTGLAASRALPHRPAHS